MPPKKENLTAFPSPSPEIPPEKRGAQDAREAVQTANERVLTEEEKQVVRALNECSDIISLIFLNEIERIRQIVSNEIAYAENWWQNVGTIADDLGVASVSTFTNVFTGALCQLYNSGSDVGGIQKTGISALKSSMFLALSFAPEHKIRAHEQQIRSTIGAANNMQEQIDKVTTRYKTAAPSLCYDNQSKVIGIVIEDYNNTDFTITSNDSGLNEVVSINNDIEVTNSKGLLIHNALERDGDSSDAITINEGTEVYSEPNIFPRPRIAGFTENIDRQYYLHDATSDSGITTNEPLNITDTSADLSGEVTDIGSNDEYRAYFEWREVGSTTWNKTEELLFNEPADFQQSLSNLTTDTEYEYRAVAELFSSGVLTDTIAGEIYRFTAFDGVKNKSFSWTGEGQAIANSIFIEGGSTHPGIKDITVHSINSEDYTLSKPDDLSEDDLFLIIDNTHRADRELNINNFESSYDSQEEFSSDYPDVTILHKVATNDEPSSYDLEWQGNDGEFIEDHDNSDCHKDIIDKMDDIAVSLQDYDEEVEKEKINQIGEEIVAVSDCIDFVMERSQRLLSDDPEKNIREVENVEEISDQLNTIEEAGFDVTAENINLRSMSRFLDQKKEELENLQSPERTLTEEEKLEWRDEQVLSDNMKLEFLKELRDDLIEIRNGLANFKRFIQELADLPPMTPTDVSLDAIRDFVQGLNQEIRTVGNFLLDDRVDLKIQGAESIGEVSQMFNMKEALTENLIGEDNIDEATDFLDETEDAIEDAKTLFQIIFRFVPYIIYGESTAEFFSEFEDLFGEPPHDKFSIVNDLFEELKDSNQTVDEFYNNDIKTWDGVFEIFTAWFDEDVDAVTSIDRALFFLTRMIDNLNRIINGEAPLDNSEIERFGQQLNEIFNDITGNTPLEFIIGVLELYLAIYEASNFFDSEHLDRLDENLNSLSNAVSDYSAQLDSEIATGDFDSFLNTEGGFATCLQIVLISIERYTVAIAESIANETEENVQTVVQKVNKTIKDLRQEIKSLIPDNLLDFELDSICDDRSYADDLQEDLDNLLKRLNEISSLRIEENPVQAGNTEG